MIKVNLTKQGERSSVSREEASAGVHIGADWNSSNDLDLHAFVKYTDGTVDHVRFSHPTCVKGNIRLDKDAGIGGRVAAGGNQENITVDSLDHVEKLTLAINDFQGGNLKRTKPHLTLKLQGKEIEVKMDELRSDGNWLTLVYLSRDEFGGHEIKNLTRFSDKKLSFDDIERNQKIEDGIEGAVDTAMEAGKSLFGKIKGLFK